MKLKNKKEIKPLDKDDYYVNTVEKMRELLAFHGFDIEEVSLINPVEGVWSVHIREKNCPFIYTNGKGHTKEAAIASGLGEFFERISCNYLFCDYYLEHEGKFIFYPDEEWADSGNFKEKALNKELWDLYGDMEFKDLIDFNSGRDQISLLPFFNMDNQSKVYFPVNILDNLYVSNGMAAGNSSYEAKVQAISEIMERNVKFEIISRGISLPEIPASALSSFADINDTVLKLNEYGYKVVINDASLGGRFPVVNINLINRNGGVFAAFGAHPVLEVAVLRTLTELFQGRDLGQFKDLKKPSFDMDLVGAVENLEEHFIDSTGYVSMDFLSDESDYDFGFVDFKGDTKKQFEYLMKILNREGLSTYIAEYDHLGIYCCRIIVPGFSEIYPVDDIFENNKNHGARLRERILKTDFENAKEAKELYDHILEGDYDFNEDLFSLTGMIKEEKYDFFLTELMFLLALKIQDREEIMLWADSVGDVENRKRRELYNAVQLYLDFQQNEKDINNYKSYIEYTYSEDLIKKGAAVADGTMSPFEAAGFSFNTNNARFRSFIALYKKSLISLGS